MAICALLLILSFFGLCAAAQERMKLHRFIAPFFCACAIICIMMFAGMLRALKWGFYITYLGGLAGAVHWLFPRRWKTQNRPSCLDRTVILTAIAFTAYLIYRLPSSYLHLPDDLAHWGAVAKYLLANDALPDASAAAVTFSSYPTGSAAFIYYVCRTLGNSEGLWMIAQSLLMFLMFLPALAHVRGNERRVLPLIPAAFLVLFKFDRPMTTLCVDWLLSFLFFGAVAAILYYKTDLRRAMLIAIPAAITAVFIKSSGFFFSACIALLVCLACAPKRRRMLCFFSILGAAIIAYLLWTAHISLSYPAPLESKHAVSLSSYISELRSKDSSLILMILKKMILSWLQPSGSQIYTVMGVVLSVGCMLIASRGNGELRPLRSDMLKLTGFSITAYAFWFAMLFAMYVFSMPKSEAKELAAYARYNSTGLLFVLGMAFIALLRFFSDDRLPFRSVRTKHACAALCALSLAAAPLLILDMPAFTMHPFYYDLTRHDAEISEYRISPKAFIESGSRPEGNRFLICLGSIQSKNSITETYYHSRFELDTADLTILSRLADKDGSWIAKSYSDNIPISDPIEYLAEHIDDYDAVLVYSEDAALDSFLKAYSGSTPILHAYS